MESSFSRNSRLKFLLLRFGNQCLPPLKTADAENFYESLLPSAPGKTFLLLFFRPSDRSFSRNNEIFFSSPLFGRRLNSVIYGGADRVLTVPFVSQFPLNRRNGSELSSAVKPRRRLRRLIELIEKPKQSNNLKRLAKVKLFSELFVYESEFSRIVHDLIGVNSKIYGKLH